MIGFVKSLFKRKDWDEFCEWLNEYLEIEPSKLPITWTKISTKAGRCVRLDFAPGKPYQVTTAIKDDSQMCDRDHAYMMANRMRYYLEKAIEEKNTENRIVGSLGVKMTVIPAKSAKKLQKSTVKTAKKPILREKCAPTAPTNKPTKRGTHPNSVANLVTPSGEYARELSFKANEIKKVRAAARARLLDIALHKGQLENLFQAGLNGDTEAMAIAEKAAKMVGLDYQASPEASQKIELAGKLDNNLNVKIEKV